MGNPSPRHGVWGRLRGTKKGWLPGKRLAGRRGAGYPFPRHGVWSRLRGATKGWPPSKRLAGRRGAGNPFPRHGVWGRLRGTKKGWPPGKRLAGRHGAAWETPSPGMGFGAVCAERKRVGRPALARDRASLRIRAGRRYDRSPPGWADASPLARRTQSSQSVRPHSANRVSPAHSQHPHASHRQTGTGAHASSQIRCAPTARAFSSSMRPLPTDVTPRAVPRKDAGASGARVGPEAAPLETPRPRRAGLGRHVRPRPAVLIRTAFGPEPQKAFPTALCPAKARFCTRVPAGSRGRGRRPA